MKLCLYGLSGSGKSTSADIVAQWCHHQGMRVQVVKLAEPLYTLQAHFYAAAGRPIGRYEQDQPLLEMIAVELRRLNERSLVNDFVRRLDVCDADVVINDDLREPFVDAPVLRERGFRFVRIRCADRERSRRLHLRGDLASVEQSATTSAIDLIDADVMIENDGTVTQLQSTLHDLLDGWSRTVAPDGTAWRQVEQDLL